MKKKPAPSELRAHCASIGTEVAAVDGKLPSRIQLMPMGTHRPRNGVPALIVLSDLDHARAVADASNAYRGPNLMVLDYDHQTVRAPAVAGKAVAAAWIGNIVADEDGVWGEEIEWTAEAAADVTGKRYRYVSPYFAYRPDGRVTRIINAGLTNTPNLDLAAVASAIDPEEETAPMNLKAIASALGLGEDADEAAILAAINRNAALAAALTATASALGVQVGDDLTAIASAATALKAAGGKVDPAKYVPVETVVELKAEMSAMRTELDASAAKERTALMDAAQKAGRLTPALRKHAETLDSKALASFLDALPESGLGEAKVSGSKPDADGVIGEELALASSLGVTPEEFRAARKIEEKA